MKIDVVGLGPGYSGYLTDETIKILKSAKVIYLRTVKHPVTRWLDDNGLKYSSFDDKYEKNNSFNDVYKEIAEYLIKRVKEVGNLTYAVPGHPLVAEKSVEILQELAKEAEVQVELHTAVSFIDSVLITVGCDPIYGLKIIDGLSLNEQSPDTKCANIVTQVYDRLRASDIKLALMDKYSPEQEIYFIQSAGLPGEIVRKIKLYELDMQKDIDHLTSIYIPPVQQEKYDFDELLNIMKKLRSDTGCPWDREQTHETLRQYLIEECYEVIESINKKDPDKLKEELGDVLFQVVFHSQIASENNVFDISDVIDGVCRKMVLRHPHIFSDVKVQGTEDVLRNWDKIKRIEKGQETYTEVLRDIPKELPALIRSYKVQQKAAKVGFDWDDIQDAIDKVYEELSELKKEYSCDCVNKEHVVEEMGDVLFACVNVARFLKVQPELALIKTIEKFIDRFEYIEKTAAASGKNLENMSLMEMDELWNESKKCLKCNK